jgi:hypothetical protein
VALCVAEVNNRPCDTVCHLVRVAWVHFFKHDFRFLWVIGFHNLFREDSCIFIVLREKALKEQSFHETDFLDMWKTDNFAV